MESVFINPGKEQWNALCKRPSFDYASLQEIVIPVLNDVKQHGDDAVKKYAAKFDKAVLQELLVAESEIAEAVKMVDNDLKAAIQLARNNIQLFHESQKEAIQKIETSEGVLCWRKSVAIQTVGLYIPGGTAPLFSTLLMLGVPAQIAGCSNIVMCTPSNTEGKVNAVILYTAQLLGIKNIFKIGGVQAVAAMAYGTQS
ncbi:MAG: histidinol dehydrogenase, partial [Gloeobacteraceae cyanobacterium ES-bin-316]|nr:histidinol dehydrogenase [Ferruginibacter sp.]